MPQYNLVRVEETRDRISLRRAVPGLRPGDLFRVDVADDGVITLTPVVPTKRKAEGDAP